MSYAENVTNWNCIHCGEPCRRGWDWREAGNGRVAHNSCAERARRGDDAANNMRTKEHMMANNKKPTVRELSDQLAALTETVIALCGRVDSLSVLTANARSARYVELRSEISALTAKMEGVADACEMEFGVSPAENIEPTHELYALPVAAHEQQAENTAVAELERQLEEAEAERDQADSWVTRERASALVESLRRELHYASFNRPRTSAQVIAIDRQKLSDVEYVEPDTSAQTREEAEKRAERFDKKTRR